MKSNLVKNDLIAKIKQKFAPFDIKSEPLISSNDNKAASVLVPFTFHDDNLVILYTHRSSLINRHRGQVSFPGGMQESGDRTYIDTALRETQEEIGIQSQQIEVFGRLQSMTATYGYLIHPYVGFIKDMNGLHKNVGEVEKIFCIPLDWLITKGNLHQEDYQGTSGIIHKVWAFREFEGERVWGITAELTRRLLEKIK